MDPVSARSWYLRWLAWDGLLNVTAMKYWLTSTNCVVHSNVIHWTVIGCVVLIVPMDANLDTIRHLMDAKYVQPVPTVQGTWTSGLETVQRKSVLQGHIVQLRGRRRYQGVSPVLMAHSTTCGALVFLRA